MRTLRITMAAALLAVAACGGGEPKEDAAADANDSAPAEPVKASAAPDGTVRLQPGQWEMKVEVSTAGMPGMPEGMQAPSTSVKTCISEQEATKPGTEIFTGNKDSNCTSEGFASAGGKMSGTVICKGGQGAEAGEMRMKVEGSFSPTAFETSSIMDTEVEGMKMTTKTRTVGRRIGDCPAGGQG